MADWLKIRNEYVSGSISYRKLAEKHGVSFNTLKGRAVTEGWAEEREKQHHRIATKTQQKVADVVSTKEADRIGRILSAADLLLAKIEEASSQLDTHIVTNKVKTKTVTYNGGMKPTKEVVVENESKEVVPGPIDRLGLQQVTAALKNIKDTVQAVEGQGDGAGVQIIDDC
ncbi:MAG: helix-turn-helix domain-containing protein [Lawsonibacter sp.]